MKIRLILSLFALQLLLFGADAPVPKEYAIGNPWLTPELYNEIDQAVRAGDKAGAIGVLRNARVRQVADRGAFRSLNANERARVESPSTRSRTITARSSAKTESGAEGENPLLVIPEPGVFCMNHAFRLRVMGDGGGMRAYINAATEALGATADSPEGTVTTEQRAEALIRMGNMQEQLLRNYAMADAYYKRALALDPDHPMSRHFAARTGRDVATVPVSSSEKPAETIKTEGKR